jgi:hypothetical protein
MYSNSISVYIQIYKKVKRTIYSTYILHLTSCLHQHITYYDLAPLHTEYYACVLLASIIHSYSYMHSTTVCIIASSTS